MSNWVSDLGRFLVAMNAELERLSVAVAPYLEAVAPHLEAVLCGMLNMVTNERLRETMVAAGWVPHHTTPLERV